MSESHDINKSAVKRLLIVEDNPVFSDQLIHAVRDLLQSWEIITHETGGSAINALSKSPSNFDLALIDLGLPDIDGIDVIRACRRNSGVSPIVVISVISTESSVLAAIEAGANGYILKDDSLEQIKTGIDQILKGIYPLSPSLARFLFQKISNTNGAGQDNNNFKLTPREFQTLAYLSQGYSYDEVAKLMEVAVTTIQWNVRQIYRKLNVHTQVQAINKARKYNLL